MAMRDQMLPRLSKEKMPAFLKTVEKSRAKPVVKKAAKRAPARKAARSAARR